MGDTKDKSESHRNLLVLSGLSGKTITNVDAHMNGSVAVIEVSFSGGSKFIKVYQNQLEVGGTQDWGTGVKQ